MKIKQNVGVIDGIIRAVLGIGCFVIANFVVEGLIDGVLEVLGATLVISAVLGYSPVYHLTHTSTVKRGQG